MLLNLDDEWKRLGEDRLPYYGAGWAYVPSIKAKVIIDLINSREQKL